jgi:hypothetical protein
MATCYLEEFETLATDANGRVLTIYPMPIAVQTKAITSSSAEFTNPLNARTRFIRIWADVSFYFETAASNPTASSSTPSVPANTPEARAVSGGDEIAARTIA